MACVPECPARLTGEARAEWERVVPELEALGVLARVDASALARYCTAHALEVAANAEIERVGLMVTTDSGTYPNPMIKVAERARAQARILGDEFGLTPASRSRVSTSPQPDEADRDEAFLFEHGNGKRPTLIRGGKLEDGDEGPGASDADPG